MGNINSKGLNTLSHFRNSRVGMEMQEPVFLNLWTCEMTLPAGLDTAGGSKTNLLLEGLQKVSGLDTSKVPGAMDQRYKSSNRSYSNAGPDNTYIEVDLDFEINIQRTGETVSLEQLKLLREWCALVYNPMTGRMGLKTTYAAPQITFTLHDKAYNPIWQWTLYNAFPVSSVTVPDLDYSNKNTPYKVTGFKLRADYWDETIL